MIRFKQLIATFITAMIVSTSAFAGLVNINKADALTIQSNLKGIGKVKAEAIVNYRKKHGEFKKIEDLVKVKGIGIKLLKKNQKDISLKKGAIKTLVKDKKAKASTSTDETKNTSKAETTVIKEKATN